MKVEIYRSGTIVGIMFMMDTVVEAMCLAQDVRRHKTIVWENEDDEHENDAGDRGIESRS